ncbi:MAG: FtsW/RodA/SpoVE family cell cycle protein [Candidatus Dojkabacteria bacterium]|jgi:cell division protein FtsW|nr:FtsW/RodA/SpoVE family cell cycle protein [Candidatus Dojkabacteria bacterium]
MVSRRKKNKRKNIKKRLGSGDRVILTLTILMLIFGAMMIFDASMYVANNVFYDKFHFLILHLRWLAIGIPLFLIIYSWDYHKILKLAVPSLIATVALLLLVLIAGDEINGAKRWFVLGEIGNIQPAEFAKIAVILYFSSWLSTQNFKYKSLNSALKDGFLRHLLNFGAILGSIAILIILEPDLGTTMIICITAFLMFLISAENRVHTISTVLSAFIIGIPLATIAAIIEPYRLERIKTYVELLLKGNVADPRGSGYQIQQILIGIGSGGFFGKGFGQSRQRFGYLVENTAFTDSTFAILLEELGFLGGSILVFAWILFFLRGTKIAQNAPDKEGKLLAMGIVIWLTLQAFLNMGANVGLIPLTGMPLPFFTYGGSSTLVTIMGIAILLNISRFSNLNGKN